MTGAITVMVPNSLGPGELITHYGTATKGRYSTKLASGKIFLVFTPTGAYAGSDATSMPDVGLFVIKAQETIAHLVYRSRLRNAISHLHQLQRLLALHLRGSSAFIISKR